MLQNLVRNGFFKYGFDYWQVQLGEPVLNERKRLLCESDTQLSTEVASKVGHQYFIRLSGKVHYVKEGVVGARLEGGASERLIGFRQAQEGLQVLVQTFTAVEETIKVTIGTFEKASIAGEIVSVEIYDLTAHFGQGSEPNATEFRQKLIQQTKEDQLAKRKFVKTMNEYAATIGMSNSYFMNPSGLNHSKQLSTAKDLHKLLLLAASSPAIQKIWNRPHYTFHVQGQFARQVEVESTVTDPALSKAYYIIGGKTGTIFQFKSLAIIVEHPQTMEWLVAVVCGMTGNRFKRMKLLFDQIVANEFTEPVGIECGIVTKLKMAAPMTQLQKSQQPLFEKNSDQLVIPASITKILSAVLVVDYMETLKRVIVVKECDIVGGSGQPFYDGDLVTLEQALYCMLLESSNTMANAVAREVGYKMKELEIL